jgi:hypothetical protein
MQLFGVKPFLTCLSILLHLASLSTRGRGFLAPIFLIGVEHSSTVIRIVSVSISYNLSVLVCLHSKVLEVKQLSSGQDDGIKNSIISLHEGHASKLEDSN